MKNQKEKKGWVTCKWGGITFRGKEQAMIRMSGQVASGVLAFVGVAEDHEHFILKVWEHTKSYCAIQQQLREWVEIEMKPKEDKWHLNILFYKRHYCLYF